jgi:hypothetical protein
MILVSVIVTDQARRILIDAAKVTWLDADLLAALNEAMRATQAVKPDFYTVRDVIDLTAGIAQALPDGGTTLIDITSNVASGQVVTQCDLALLQEVNRFWPADDQVLDVDNFATNVKEPTRFFVTPPNNGYGRVNASWGAVPPVITGLTDELPVLEIYQTPLLNFVLGRAYAMNTKKQDITKATYYMNEWGKALGLKTQAQIAIAPKVTDTPEAR